MKKLHILLLILTLLLCGCTQRAPAETQGDEWATLAEPEATVDETEATEPVPMMTVTRTVRGSVLDEKGNEVLYMEYAYDEFGRQVEFWQYNGDGTLSSFSSTVYTSDTEYETTFDSGDSSHTVRYTCDEAGNKLTQETDLDGEITVTSYTYDEYGNMLTTDMAFPDGTGFSLVYEYTYDENGNPLTVHEYQDGQLTGWREITYDSEGRQTATLYYLPDGALLRSIVTTWEGNTQTDVSYNNHGHAYLTRIIVTDDMGNVLSQETWQEDVMVSRTEYTYGSFEIPAE